MSTFECPNCKRVTKINASNITGYTCTCGTELVIDNPKPATNVVKKKTTVKKKAKSKIKLTPALIIILLFLIWFLAKWLPIIGSGDY